MKKMKGIKRILAALMAVALIVTGLPEADLKVSAAVSADGTGVIATVDDPQTLTRPIDTYGNSTLNAGKILVGKSVTDAVNDTDGSEEPLDLTAELGNMPAAAEKTFSPEGENNFLVTVSQTAQMYGVSSKMPVPLDVVFVLDTSGSMDQPYKVNGVRPGGATTNRAQDAVEAINDAIETLMAINEYNRVSVVTFSAHNSDYGNEGQTDARNNAATVLSALDHYEDQGSNKAASEHLTWSGSDRRYLNGRDADNTVGNKRNGYAGATNIQAGIALGAQQLLNVPAKDTVVTIEGKEIVRKPFIILVSDGAPVITAANSNWWEPSMTEYAGDYGTYTGNSFLPVLTAAYYKQEITEHYYGDSGEKAVFYTIGVGLDSENKDESEAMSNLARMTLNPSEEFLAGSGNSYYSEFASYWENYRAKKEFRIKVDSEHRVTSGTGWNSVTYYHDGYFYFYPIATEVDNPNDYQYFADNNNTNSDKEAWKQVTGPVTIASNMPEIESLYYNDDYYDVEDSTTLTQVFRELIVEIQKRAITDPTKVDTTWGDSFSGYVNFTDIIGEYMEVKDIKGITNNGYLYQGKSFARLAENYRADWASNAGTSAEQAAFNAALEEAVMNRMVQADSDDNDVPLSITDVRTLMAKVVGSDDTYGSQIYYESDDNYSNSFVWFGNIHTPTDSNDLLEEDYKVEFVELAPKDADSVTWISDEANASVINAAVEAGADCIVRSYYVYGTAGGVNTTSTGEYLNFSLRTIRRLESPYKHYVSISAPASLLSVQHVLIDDTDPNNLIAHYDDLIPTRVIYEVGLQEGITADNVWSVVGQDYLNEYGNVNTDGSINFYTNDFKRYDDAEDAAGHTGAVHDHAYTYVTYDVSDSNSFYRYEKDTLLVDAEGNPITGVLVPGSTYYYERIYYTWDPTKPVTTGGKVEEGVAPAVQTYKYIPVVMPDDQASAHPVYQDSKTGYWYIQAGTYTSSTLTDGDDILKSANETITAHIVSHPERTGSATNSHYTTWLGNNGKLTFMGVPAKTVMRDDPATTGVETANIDGEIVKVGDVLTYQIRVTNAFDVTTDIEITDKIPAGTEIVVVDNNANATIKNGVLNTDNTITWSNSPVESYDSATGTIKWNIEDVAPGTTVVVSFDVVVAEGAVVLEKINNAAEVYMPEAQNQYTTNMTTNPVTGKRAVDASGNVIKAGVTVGSVIEYQIAYFNDQDIPATITVTDIIPEGTVYVADSASHVPKIVYTDDTTGEVTKLAWEFTNVQPGFGGVVTFEVKVDASVQDSGKDENTTPDVSNYATIQIEDNPNVDTNTTITDILTGNLNLSKVVENEIGTTGTFTLKLVESTGKLTGKYVTSTSTVGSTEPTVGEITFAAGEATVTIMDNQTVTVKDLPAGVIVTVSEPDPGTGFTATLNPTNGIVTIGTGASNDAYVAVTNTYKAGAAELILGGTKRFTNNGLYDNTQKFYFELKEVQNGGIVGQATNLAANVELTAGAGAEVSNTFVFNKLTYNTTGTYYYQMSELHSGVSGVKYDDRVYSLKVEVTDDGSGTLKATAYCEVEETAELDWQPIPFVSGTNSIDLGALEFTNIFKPLRESLSLIGKKTLENATMSNDQFSFLVKEGENTVATGQSKADGSIVFTTIPYTAAGEHIYTIEEVTGAPNMAYGGEKYYLKVVVEEDTDNAVLTKTIYQGTSVNGPWTPITDESMLLVKDSSILVFTNTYIPDDHTVILEGTKKLIGRDMAIDEFDFIVVDKVTAKQVSTGTNQAADNGAEGNIIFQPISYKLSDLGDDKTETYTYVVSEVNEGKDGIGYSAASYEVTVTVTYNDSTGWSEVVTYPGTGVKFENTFTPPGVPVTISIPVTKTITSVSGGDIPADLTFGFEAIKAEKAIAPDGSEITDGYAVGDVVGTGISAVPGDGKAGTATVNVAFTEMNFYKPGVYQCWLVETNAGKDVHGVQYSSVRYLMVITVTQDEDTGLLTAVPAYYASDVAGSTDVADYKTPVETLSFENAYKAEGTLVITAKKELTGRDLAASAGLFDFTLTEQGGSGTVHTGTNAADGTITFDTLTFVYDDTFINDTKTLTYIMAEVAGKLPGIVYDDTTYTVTVTLTHDGEGKIFADYSVVPTNVEDTTAQVDGKVAVFKNTGTVYEGISTTVDLTKTLTGRDMKDGEFGFALTHLYTIDQAGQTIQKNVVEDTTSAGAATDGVAADVELDVSISATDGIGKHVFEITEVNNNLGGVTYDGSVYRVEITTVDSNQDGKLEISGDPVIAKIKNAKGEDVNETVTGTPAYVNSYVPSTVDITLVGHKSLSGRTLNADEFDFEIYEISREIDGVKENHSTPVLKETGSNTAAGTIAFTPITIDKPGIYTYKVVELTNNLPLGVTPVSPNAEGYTVVITVTDNQAGGLETKVEVDGALYDGTLTGANAQLHFKNKYDAQDTVIKLEGIKTLTGRDMRSGEFTFYADLVAKNGNAVTPARAAVGSNTGTGSSSSIDFSEIPYSEAGTYTYNIYEADTDAGNVATDKSVFQVVVTVVDEGAALKATAAPASRIKNKEGKDVTAVNEAVVFDNIYTPTPATATVQATKLLYGKPWNGDEFTFRLTETAGLTGDDVDGFITAENTEKVIVFGPITFTEKGVYKYTITEEGIDTKNMNYDNESSYGVTITVTDDGNGTLTANVAYDNAAPVFSNNYTPDPVQEPIDGTIAVKKNLEGRAKLLDGEFNFIVKDVQDNIVAKGFNRADGSVVFDYDLATEAVDGNGIEFKHSGIYRYNISEVDDQNFGVTYDSAVWHVQFDIIQNPDGTLACKEKTIIEVVGSAADPAKGVVFTNEYDPTDAEVTLIGQKFMTGNRSDVKEGEFIFHLLDEAGNIAARGTTDAEGRITFEKLTFDKVSVNTYTLVEVHSSANGIEYNINNDSYKVVIDVAEKMENGKYVGALQANVTIDGKAYNGALTGTNAQIQFTNQYTPSETAAYITAKKVLNGAELTANAFAFELVDENGVVAATVNNYADGNIVFPKMSFDAADMKDEQGNTVDQIVKNYIIREVAGNNSNITYDSAEYTVKITVTDDKLGQLHASVAYGTTDGNVPVFTNTYIQPTPPPSSEPKVLVKLEGTKTFLGGTLTDGQFKFEIKRSDGIPCGSGTSRADGTIDFYSMGFTEAGKYVVIISEVNDGQAGVVYDTAKFEVVIDVYENSGSLDAKVYYPEGGIAFTNRMAGNEAPRTGDNSPIMLLLAALLVCGGSLIGLFAWHRKKSR